MVSPTVAMPSAPVLKELDLTISNPGAGGSKVLVVSLSVPISSGAFPLSEVSRTVLPSRRVPSAMAEFKTSPVSISACVNKA